MPRCTVPRSAGARGYELFDEDSRRRAVARIELEAAIRQAVARSELRVHYQPRVALQDFADVTWVDAQVHWQHPQRGLIPPEEFRPLAEETGMVIPIGRFALEHALAQLARWRESKPDMQAVARHLRRGSCGTRTSRRR